MTALHSSVRRFQKRQPRCIKIDMPNIRSQYNNERPAQRAAYEQYAFPLFSHIDFRVSDAQAVRPFYDALMALFGTEPTARTRCS